MLGHYSDNCLGNVPSPARRFSSAEVDIDNPSTFLHVALYSSGGRVFLGTRRHLGHMVFLEAEVMSSRLLRIGVVGSVLAAICCFSPVLVVLLDGIGLSAAIGYLDAILLPTLAIFLGITGCAIWTRNETR